MEKAYIRRYNTTHVIHKTYPAYEYDYTDNFDTYFRPLPEVVAYDPYFVDPQYGFDPYWDDEIYDQDKLEYKDTYNKPNDQIESDDPITDAHVSHALRYVMRYHRYHTSDRDHRNNKGKKQSSMTKFYHSSR